MVLCSHSAAAGALTAAVLSLTLSPYVTTSNSPPAIKRAIISHMGLDWACSKVQCMTSTQTQHCTEPCRAAKLCPPCLVLHTQAWVGRGALQISTSGMFRGWSNEHPAHAATAATGASTKPQCKSVSDWGSEPVLLMYNHASQYSYWLACIS